MSGRHPPVLPAGCRHEKAHIFDLNFVDPCGVLTQMIALLRELITARTIHSKYMDSKVAHNTAQRFNTEVRHTAVQQEVYSPNTFAPEYCRGRYIVEAWNFRVLHHTSRSTLFCATKSSLLTRSSQRTAFACAPRSTTPKSWRGTLLPNCVSRSWRESEPWFTRRR